GGRTSHDAAVGVTHQAHTRTLSLEAAEREEIRSAIHAECQVAVHRARGGQRDEGLIVRVRGVPHRERGLAQHRGHGAPATTSQTTTRDCTPLRSDRMSSVPRPDRSTRRVQVAGSSVQPTKLRKTTRAPGAATRSTSEKSVATSWTSSHSQMLESAKQSTDASGNDRRCSVTPPSTSSSDPSPLRMARTPCAVRKGGKI